ncbi:MAG: EAL domain-containing protein [Methylobacter sp.]|nr:EAL domain-containing protein [Methylobacter sp.]
MKKTGNGGASDAHDPLQPDGSGPHKDSLPAELENAIAYKENAVIDAETAILSREKLTTAREEAVHLRENASTLREYSVYPREKAVQAREDIAHLRETAVQVAREVDAHGREVAATSRGREIHAAERLQAVSDDHLSMLQEANAHLVIATIEAQKMAEQVQVAKEHLAHLAHHDILTALPNRLLLQDRLGQAIELARRHGRQLSVMFMDLDRFKYINDSLGHAMGDQLLQSVARRLRDCVRRSDTISRQGGDEFMLLLPTIKHAEDVALCAQKMLAALALPHRIGGHDLHISVSIGISIYPRDGQDGETLIKSADTAMYYAKENGRNTYKFFEPAMNARAIQRHSIEDGLRRALERQDFVLHYQPKINLHSGVIVGAEALIRWQHPKRGLVQPGQFVPIAEDSGLILPMGRWMLREACLQARAWLQAGLPPISVAVNISALEFGARDFLKNIRATLEDTGLEPHCLELELTESVLMQDAEPTNTLLKALSELGIKLAIDDFGTGYSSLSYLRQFPIHTLKIDQSFVSRIPGNTDDATLVSAMIHMGKCLKLRVVAKGVETPEQYAFLLAQQCDEGQGYYFGRPMVAEAFAVLLQTGILPTILRI